MTKANERIVVFAFGVAFVAALIALAIEFPNPTPWQYEIFRSVLALAASGVAAMIPGFLGVTVANWVRAGGAIAVFVLLLFKSPAQLVVESTPPISQSSTSKVTLPIEPTGFGRVAQIAASAVARTVKTGGCMRIEITGADKPCIGEPVYKNPMGEELLHASLVCTRKIPAHQALTLVGFARNGGDIGCPATEGVSMELVVTFPK